MNNKKVIKFLIVIALCVLVAFISGCGSITKHAGGTSTIDLAPGKKLLPYTVQWEPKSSNIWYLVEDAENNYVPKTYEFIESSNLGVLEGKIVFVEHK